jgi:hypothetical protein
MILVANMISGIKDFIMLAGEIAGIFAIGLIVGLIGAIRKQKNSSKWSPAREKKFVEKHSTIHELLTELRVTVRASRAVVFQFHNGGNYVDGGSIKRFSVTHESCEIGVSALLLDSQDVLLTKYTDMIGVMETKPSKILSIYSLPHSPFRSALEINNVEFFTITPLKCDDGITPLGFLCCHWCSSDSLDEIEREDISKSSVEELVAQTTQSINSYLTYSTGTK